MRCDAMRCIFQSIPWSRNPPSVSLQVRMIRSVPELVTLIKGMAAAARSVSATLVLLVVALYVAAIIAKQQWGRAPQPTPV